MKILITGATGFIGTNTAIELGRQMRLIFTGLITKKKPHKFIKQGNWIKG